MYSQSWWGTSGLLCQFLGPSVQKRQGASGEHLVESIKVSLEGLEHLSDEERLWELHLLSEEEKAERESHQSIQTSQRWVSGRCCQALFSGAQDQDKEQWLWTKTREVLPPQQEELFYIEGGRAVEQAAQGGSSACYATRLWDIL